MKYHNSKLEDDDNEEQPKPPAGKHYNSPQDDEADEEQDIGIPSFKGATPEKFASLVMKRGGPFLCKGRDWWRWNSFIWEYVAEPEFYKRACLEVQPAGQRSTKLANEIFELIRYKCQTDAEWRLGVGFKNENTVMVNVQNGVVRVNLANEEMELIDANPKHYAIAQLPVSFVPDAECPVFAKLLRTALPDRMDRYLLQCYAGYCLLPDFRFQCVMLCQGAPNSGKSLLIYHGLGSVFGKELMSHVSLEKICAGGDELRHLSQSLVNLGTEIDSRLLKDSAVFNQLACGEPMDAALKYQKSKTIRPTCKQIFISNPLPHWDRGSEAQARRIVLLHFPNDFSKEPKDGQLERRVDKEHDGIFNWMLRGLLNVAQLKQMPVGGAESRTMMGKFRKHNNPLGAFIHEYTEGGDELFRMSAPEFRRTFSYWCSLEGISFKSSMTTKYLLRDFHKLRIESSHIEGKRCRVLFGLRFNKRGQKLNEQALKNFDSWEDL